MTHITCRLTANNWDRFRKPTLGSQVWATFTFLQQYIKFARFLFDSSNGLQIQLVQAESLRVNSMISNWMVDVLTGQDQAGGRPYAKYRGAGTRKVKPIWILLKQRDSQWQWHDISWAICKSAPRFRQITTPPPYHSVFAGWGMPWHNWHVVNTPLCVDAQVQSWSWVRISSIST